MRLQYEVIGHIKGIKCLQLSEDKRTFNLKKHLSFENNIYGLTLPHTYEEVFKAAMGESNTHNFSASGENFVDVAAFRLQTSIREEKPQNKAQERLPPL